MVEPLLFAALALLLFAAASHRFRTASGVTAARQIVVLRIFAAALLVTALIRTESAVDGERWIKLIAATSIDAVALTLLLSRYPGRMLWPVRRLLQAVAR